MIGYLILSRIYFILKEIDKNERTKETYKKELTRIRAIQQISHQIAHMVNIVLRNYSNNERYRGRTQLRLVLDNIDRRLEVCELKLNHNGGAIVGFYNSLPLYMDKSIGHINRHYTYIKPIIAKEHAIMHYGDSILNSIECNKFSDINYNRLKCNNPKYVCEDKEMGAIIYPDLKAAYVEESKVFIGEDLK